jgi:hypothetical protein
MFDATVVVQVARVQGISGHDDAYPCAVLSGPGAVWLRSRPSRPAPQLSGESPAREQARG